MADIQLRLGKDMLVLSTSIAHQLEKQGVNAERDTALTLLIEPETLKDIYDLESLCGVQCAVAPTAGMTPARLAHTGMSAQAPILAEQAMDVVTESSYQHVLVEIGPCGLPLDASSKASLMENRDQYASAARYFEGFDFDAFFLNGFSRIADLKCALMGVAKVSDKPVFASVDIDANGVLSNFDGKGVAVGESVEEAACAAAELGASVFGFCTKAGVDEAASALRRISEVVRIPMMVQLFVQEGTEGYAFPYADADDIVDAAEVLQASGAQFLRACGFAPASYAGALVATTESSDVVEVEAPSVVESHAAQDVDDLARRLRQRVNDTLKG